MRSSAFGAVRSKKEMCSSKSGKKWGKCRLCAASVIAACAVRGIKGGTHRLRGEKRGVERGRGVRLKPAMRASTMAKDACRVALARL